MAPHSRILYFSFLIALLALTGCASQVDRPHKAAEKARDTSADIQSIQDQMDRTVAALQAVLQAPPTELKTSFDEYSKELDKTKALAKRMDLDAAQMRARSEVWLAKWEASHAEITTDELRRVSEQRREQVMNRFHGIQASYDRARNELSAFMQRLDDVRRTLENDLTANGVATVAKTDVVKNVTKLASDVKRDLNAVQSQTLALADELKPEAPAEASSKTDQTTGKTSQ